VAWQKGQSLRLVTEQLLHNLPASLHSLHTLLSYTAPSECQLESVNMWLSAVLQVPGYTRRVEREWSYSDKVCNLLSDYMAK